MDITSTRARKLDKDKFFLQLVVFDVVMWCGKDVSRSAYETRLQMLVRFFESAKKIQSVILIPDCDHRISTAQELVNLMRTVTAKGWEGYVLKDPASMYRFERTRAVQKVKLSGPEINAGVVGLGFSLSSNPRRWGLLTAIEHTMNGGQLVTYCRTEVLEGDRLYRAFQHVHKDLHSTVSVKRLLAGASENRARNAVSQTEVLLPKYKVVLTRLADSNVQKVEWIPLLSGGQPCTLLILPDALRDVQWLCNPHECAFTLSLKGDIRPLERSLGHAEDDAIIMMMIPRHPVGRIEFGTQLAGSIDSIESTAKKFEEAIDVRNCVETHTLRSVARMRALPASRQRLEEIGRIARGWLASYNTVDEKWPQMPPPSLSIDGLSKTLVSLADNLKARQHTNPEQTLLPLVNKALGALTLAERQAMAMLPSRSQWIRLDSRSNNAGGGGGGQNTIGVVDEADAIDAAQAECEINSEARQARFRVLKSKVRPPVIMAGSYTREGGALQTAHTTLCYDDREQEKDDKEQEEEEVGRSARKDTLHTLLDGIKPFAPPGFTSMPLISKPYHFQEVCQCESEQEEDMDDVII